MSAKVRTFAFAGIRLGRAAIAERAPEWSWGDATSLEPDGCPIPASVCQAAPRSPGITTSRFYCRATYGGRALEIRRLGLNGHAWRGFLDLRPAYRFSPARPA